MSSRPSRSRWRRPLEAWSIVQPYVGGSGWRLSYLGALSTGRALAEPMVILLVAQIGVAITGGSEAITVILGPFGPYNMPLGLATISALVFAFAMFGLGLGMARVMASMEASGLETARGNMLHAFMEANWDLQAQERSGHLQDLLTTYVSRITNGVASATVSISAALSLFVILVAVLLVNPVAATGTILAVVLLAGVLRPLSRATRRSALEQATTNQGFATDVSETIAVSVESRVFGVTGAVVERLDESIAASSRATRKVTTLRRVVPTAYQSLAIILVILGLGALVLRGASDIGGLATMLALFIRAMSYGQQLQTAIQQANEVVPYLQQMREEELRYRDASTLDVGGPRDSIGDIEFDGVSYSYSSGDPALSDLSFTIARGECVGVVGPSGSGKSTLVQLLLRLREPTSGTINVGAEPLTEWSRSAWYERVAIVPQDARLLTGTIADNISFFRGVPRDAIEAAARGAHLHDEIVAMPHGYDTEVGGLSGSMSGGQAQRLCLARALVGEPDLVVLDEPTSALDARSEALVQETLDALKGSVTMVIIAHRLSTLRLCDRIMVLERGSIAAFDDQQTLLDRESFYREAFELSKLS